MFSNLSGVLEAQPPANIRIMRVNNKENKKLRIILYRGLCGTRPRISFFEHQNI